MLPADMNMRPANGPLEHGPEGFQRIHVAVAARPFLGAVIDGLMLITKRFERAIRLPFIGADPRALGDLADDLGDERLAGGVGNDLAIHLAVPLKDAEHNGLAGSAPSALAAPLAADISFIGLDMAGQRRLAVERAHVFPDLMRHAEGGRVADAQLALQFLGGHAMPRGREQVHRIEPFLQRYMRAVKGRADHGVNLMAAPCALVGWMTARPVKLTVLAAARAIQRFAAVKLHQIVKARIIVGKLLKKLLNVRAVLHRRILRTHEYGSWGYGCQVYNRVI